MMDPTALFGISVIIEIVFSILFFSIGEFIPGLIVFSIAFITTCGLYVLAPRS
jgi:hypothetical protein